MVWEGDGAQSPSLDPIEHRLPHLCTCENAGPVVMAQAVPPAQGRLLRHEGCAVDGARYLDREAQGKFTLGIHVEKRHIGVSAVATIDHP